jgi:hypothetical protein
MTITLGFLLIGFILGSLVGLTFGRLSAKTDELHPILFDERKYDKILSDIKRQEQKALEFSLR